MKEPQAPTLEELLAEFERMSPAGGGKTITEWAGAWAMSIDRARKLIAWAITNGRMRTGTMLRSSITRPGYRCMVHVHEFVPAKKKGRR